MPSSITVKTNGQTLSVNASISHWTTAALANAASTSNDVESSTWTTITSDYAMYFSNTAQFVTVTVKQADGSTLYTGTFKAGPGAGARTVEPLPSAVQVGADIGSGNGLLAAGAIAETIPRAMVNTNGGVLSTGRMSLIAIHLRAGTPITSATFHSATTAGGTLTNQWFALYNSGLTLLRQTVDDTSTAWGANSAKTLAFTSVFTTTYSGLHYLGINVTAGTVPTLMSFTSLSVAAGLTPILNGTSSVSLTDTAPASALAITGGAIYPYAYVS